MFSRSVVGFLIMLFCSLTTLLERIFLFYTSGIFLAGVDEQPMTTRLVDEKTQLR